MSGHFIVTNIQIYNKSLLNFSNLFAIHTDDNGVEHSPPLKLETNEVETAEKPVTQFTIFAPPQGEADALRPLFFNLATPFRDDILLQLNLSYISDEDNGNSITLNEVRRIITELRNLVPRDKAQNGSEKKITFSTPPDNVGEGANTVFLEIGGVMLIVQFDNVIL